MTVHWFGSYFSVPFAVGIVSIIIITLIIFIAAYATITSKYYVCQKCGKRFKGRPWDVFSSHMGDDRLLRCPVCRKKTVCVLSYDQKSDE